MRVIPLRELPQTPFTAQRQFPDYNGDRLFDAYDRKQKERDAALWSRSVFALCAQNSRTGDQIENLAPDVMSINLSDCPDSILKYAAQCDGATTIAALDIDIMGDLGETVPQLIALRRANPTLTIVIMPSLSCRARFRDPTFRWNGPELLMRRFACLPTQPCF